jgi:PHD/YefM family antitoxin component YafN of YafNO toxin-antitoxin module
MSKAMPKLTTLPASQMRRDQDDIFSRLKKGPLLFTRHGQAAGVLVEPAAWNQLLERLEKQSDLITALSVELEEERGETTFEPLDVEELKAWANGESTVPA